MIISGGASSVDGRVGREARGSAVDRISLSARAGRDGQPRPRPRTWTWRTGCASRLGRHLHASGSVRTSWRLVFPYRLCGAIWRMRRATSAMRRLTASAGLLNDPIFNAAVAHTNSATRDAWAAVVAAATNQPGSTPLRKYLERSRNRATFHYDRTRLWEGYEHHFSREPASQFNERAYMSLGRTMAATRFYFADAAVTFAYSLSDRSGGMMSEVNQIVKAVNRALRNIVEAYIRERGRSSSSGAPPGES